MGKSLRKLVRRYATWRERAATRLYIWVFDMPPALARNPWRITYWRAGPRWQVYVFRGTEWFGAGSDGSLVKAVHAARMECQGTLKSRRARVGGKRWFRWLDTRARRPPVCH